MKTKICSCCGQAYPIQDFGKNCQAPDGLAYYTRKHAALKQREFRLANPDKTKAARERYLDKVRTRNLAAR